MSRLHTDRNGTAAPALTNGERFLVIKRQLHQQLITGMDLAAIGTMNEDELRVEVRRAAEELIRHGSSSRRRPMALSARCMTGCR